MQWRWPLIQTELREDQDILMGKENQRERVRKRLKEALLLCGNFEMRELKEEKWLGDYLGENLKDCVLLATRKREAKIRRVSYEEEWREKKSSWQGRCGESTRKISFAINSEIKADKEINDREVHMMMVNIVDVVDMIVSIHRTFLLRAQRPAETLSSSETKKVKIPWCIWQNTYLYNSSVLRWGIPGVCMLSALGFYAPSICALQAGPIF